MDADKRTGKSITLVLGLFCYLSPRASTFDPVPKFQLGGNEVLDVFIVSRYRNEQFGAAGEVTPEVK